MTAETTQGQAVRPTGTRDGSARPTTRATGWIHDLRLPGALLFVQAAQFMTVIMLAASMAPSL